jgi:hypothetical protein
LKPVSESLAARFDQLSGYIAGDVERLGYGPTLGDQARNIMGGREENAFRSFSICP